MLSANNRRSRKTLDDKLLKFKELADLRVPSKGWLRAVREAIGMSGVQLARRLGITPQSVDDLERSEAGGGIRIETLRRAAEALDCTLVYALVPRGSLEQTVEDRARSVATRLVDRVDQTMALEAQRVDAIGRSDLVDDYIREHLRDRDLWNAE